MHLESQTALPNSLQNSSPRNPSLPLSSKMLLVLWVWSFSGITQWVIIQSSNNHLVQSASGSQSDSPIAVLYFPRNGQCVEIISCTFFSRYMASVKFQKFKLHSDSMVKNVVFDIVQLSQTFPFSVLKMSDMSAQ